MCGISGIFDRKLEKIEKSTIEKINDSLIHRGPDFGSVVTYGNVALGHRRLSIIDLSHQANQPMTSSDGRYTIVFNGEVYNFQDIKDTLQRKAVNFSTASDTEVLLKAFEEYGTSCFAMLNGMFAFAIYDKIKKELFLTRDQFGIKPLYFLNNNERFIFASEIKAIQKYPDLSFSINKQALVEYIWFSNPLGENTIYSEISELKPGHFLVISKEKTEEHCYFDINLIKEIKISEKEAVIKTRNLLEASIKRHLISDVPVGIFLSGGIDSSAITAFASKHYKNPPLQTFSVGFDYDKGINELSLAKKIAAKYKTNHHEVHVSGNNIIEVIKELVIAHDEPFGDAADIPLYLLTKNLKETIKVVLQGDGGDEFFGGYSRYNTISNVRIWSLLTPISYLISISGTNNTKVLRFQRFINAITQKQPHLRTALLLTMESKYSNPLRIFNEGYSKTLESYNPFKKFEEIYNKFNSAINQTQALFFTDTQTILKDTYFEKVDKSTMANSMEVRVPFIDKELAEFILSVPANIKTKSGVKKYLLKKALNGIVPDVVLYGKKKGFSVPYDYWLITTLSDFFMEQISTEKSKIYLNQNEILRMFENHKKGKGNYGSLLWKTLIFSVWINSNSYI